MKILIFFAVFTLLFTGFNSVFAETQTNQTDMGSIDVRLSYDEIVPGQMTTIKTDFLKPGTQEIQPHIDWTFSVSKDGQVIWGPTQLSHTAEGSLKNLRYEFDQKGTYNLQFTVEGILFQIIPTEKVAFEVIVGAPSTIPKPSVDAITSKSFYKQGESVGVSGKIKNYNIKLHSYYAVEYIVLNPDDSISKIGKTTPSEVGSFNFNFVAKDEGFEQIGDYTIRITFGSSETDIPLYLQRGEVAAKDNTPPRITQLNNIEVVAETADSLTVIEYEVKVVDNMDQMIKPSCKPESGFSFGIGETVIKCTAKDSAGNFAIPMQFSVIVSPPVTSIPNWVKNVAGFWCQERIDDGSFIEGLQFLIDNDIIIVPAKSEKEGSQQDIPQWVKNNACWWSEGSITDLDFASGIQFLVKQGIIVV